jgi:predicted CoA-binding protein
VKEEVMKDEDLKVILTGCKTVAIVGISPKEDRPSYIVASYLQSKGYRIIPVRPDGDTILGEKVYHNLMEIPNEMEVAVVDIFRRSEDVPPIVDEAIQRGAKVVWMQEGVVHKEAGAKAEKAGLKVLMDCCMKKEHQRLINQRQMSKLARSDEPKVNQ